MKSLMRLWALLLIGIYLGTCALPLVAFAQTNTAPLPTCQLQLNTKVISVGGSVTLKWASTNATGGAITNVGNVGPSGSTNLLPSSAAYTTYIGSFTGPGGTANCSATVQVSAGGGGGTSNASSAAPPAAVSTNNSSKGVVSSSGSGLVPCGFGAFSATNGTGSATGCQACDLATLIQNIINFAIGIAIPISAALFAYAGVLYFTSAGDHHKLEQAKGIFKNAFVGFMIAITAWLVVNTLLHTIFSQGEFAGGSWFTIQCSTTARPVTGSISTVLSQVLGNASVTNNVVSTSGTGSNGGGGGSNCPAGYTFTPGNTSDGTTDTCYNATTDMVQDPTPAGQQCPTGSTYYPGNSSAGTASTCYNATTDQVSDPLGGAPGGSTVGSRGVAQCSSDNTACSVSALQDLGLTSAQANVMSCIAITESSGNPAVGCSVTATPCGTFQINNGNWNAYAPAGCQSLTQKSNAACNLQTAAIMVQNLGYQPWTGSSNGVAWNPAASTCANNYGS
jgi:hypothetical protein